MSDRSKYSEAHGYHGKSCSGMHFNVEGVNGVFLAYEDYDLLREAAEAWAADRTALDNGWSYNHEHCCWTCMECYVALQPFDQSPVLHAATCKAARILGLKREGA